MVGFEAYYHRMYYYLVVGHHKLIYLCLTAHQGDLFLCYFVTNFVDKLLSDFLYFVLRIAFIQAVYLGLNKLMMFIYQLDFFSLFVYFSIPLFQHLRKTQIVHLWHVW